MPGGILRFCKSDGNSVDDAGGAVTASLPWWLASIVVTLSFALLSWFGWNARELAAVASRNTLYSFILVKTLRYFLESREIEK